ncbi:hypothetical protein M758_5G115100 [Ceratodon purpureus]|nr:hypothetical protein M758_5G115100 [Ceratodon purpureus]
MAMLDLWPIKADLPLPGMIHSLVVSLFVLSPFPFYWYLWTYPKKWLKMCEGVDPSHRMAQVAHLLKSLQILGLLSVATFSVPPIICVALFGFGQFLNYRVIDLLGEDGVYYGARFGKKLPWVEKFPFGYFRDPQYVGSIMSLLGVSCWVPFPFIALWIVGYFFMMVIEREEDSNSRAVHIS